MLRALSIAVALALCACAPTPAPQPAPPKPASSEINVRADGFDAAAQKACVAQGGTYQIGGLLGRFYCVTPYADAGKPCTDKADCQGQCRADSAAAMGAKATGKCAANDSPFGCNASINKGVVSPVLCVD